MHDTFFRAVSRNEFTDLLRRFPCLPDETAGLDAAAGRFLATEVIAAETLPLADRASMDGYAVRATDVFGASEGLPAYLDLDMDIPIGILPEKPLPRGCCARIVTGGYLPSGADAVVMIEHTADVGAGVIEFRRPVAPGDNVMLTGEDAMAGQPLLAAGTRLRPQEIGLLAALGIVQVPVRRVPRVAILSTGDELVPAAATPKPGQIRDVNTHALLAMLRAAGATATAVPPIPDDLDRLRNALGAATADFDLTLISGGSSVGTRDLTVEAIKGLGGEILAHGVAISPGKPTILASINGAPCLGLPGQVAAAQIVMLVFGLPFVAHLAGSLTAFDPPRDLFPAELARNIASKQGREDHVRVRLEARPGLPPLAHPVLGKSGLLKTLLAADGVITIPADMEGREQGAVVFVRPV
ncbi:molybdopterin molybdotransferase MoeA [Megalodesulfovibrio paquesii]